MPEMKRKWKGLIRWVLISITSVLLFFIAWVLIVAVEHPPVVDDLSYLNTERQTYGDTTFVTGNNWMRKSESGLWEMYVEGDPFERGAAFGKLTEDLMLYQESAFFEMIEELIPNPAYLRFLKYFTAWFNRNMGKNIPDEYKIEIYGTSFSCSPVYDFIGTGYQRQLNYHAAHDIGHVLMGLGMVGCTSFSCWNEKSADSSLIIGRNFDFFAGPKFAENKIVCFYNPSTGYKFMMVSWAGMIGAVSGMNEKGITVTINASKSTFPLQASTPVTLVAREILQYAENISQAYAIARKRKLFVSESILIGSASDGRSAIIEKSPSKNDIIFSTTDQIICTNHFQGEAFKNDKVNIKNIRGSESQYRFDRVTELLHEKAKIDINDAVSILRNRYGIENKDVGLGNPMSVNQLIAHHSIVFKPSEQLVWVSTEPYQLGKFVAYDLNKVFSITTDHIIGGEEIYSSDLTIPADSFLCSPEYLNYTKFLAMTDELKEHTSNKRKLPPAFVKNYIEINPELYMTYSQLGDYYLEMEDYDQALYYYKLALSKEVAGNDQREDMTTIARKISKKLEHANTEN